jgi:hypothetical protein
LHARHALAVGSVALSVAGSVALAWQVAVVGGLSWPVTLAAIAACLLGIFIAGGAADPRGLRRDPRPLSITSGALFAGEERLLERGAVTQAFVTAGPRGSALVQLRGRGWRRIVACDTEAEGQALLHALELDASRTTAVYRLASQLMLVRARRTPVLAGAGLAWAAAVAAMLAAGSGVVSAVGLFAAMAGLVALGAILLWPTGIRVGADAVVIRWMGRERRLRLDEIERVIRSPGRLQLVLRTEEVIELVYPGKVPTEEDLARWAAQGLFAGPVELARAGARIEEALAAYPREREDAPELSLERGSRRTDEWLRHLRSVGGSARAERSGYRRPALPPEKLWRVVEDPASPPGARAGAAVALSHGLDEPGKQRLRIAAEATALPGMRVLLESAAAEEAADEAALCELLDQVDDGGEARRRV